FFFSSRRRHTSSDRDWSSDVCSSDLTMVGAFAEGNVLQVLLVSVIVGSTLVALGSRARAVIELLEIGSEMLFRAVAIVMWVAPRSEERRVGEECGVGGCETPWMADSY